MTRAGVEQSVTTHFKTHVTYDESKNNLLNFCRWYLHTVCNTYRDEISAESQSVINYALISLTAMAGSARPQLCAYALENDLDCSCVFTLLLLLLLLLLLQQQVLLHINVSLQILGPFNSCYFGSTQSLHVTHYNLAPAFTKINFDWRRGKVHVFIQKTKVISTGSGKLFWVKEKWLIMSSSMYIFNKLLHTLKHVILTHPKTLFPQPQILTLDVLFLSFLWDCFHS